MDPKALDQELKKVLAIIFKQDTYTKKEADEISGQVVQYWKETINPGFLDYRKSVADDFAAVEWKDGTPGGSVFTSLHGNEYIDCLGGFGIYNCGHRHPKILAAVKSQLEKQALHSQELLDPLRAYCGHLLRLIAPKGLQYSFFTNSGTESVEACLKFAMMATKRHHFLATTGSFHGKTLGALSTTSKSVFRAPFGPALLSVAHVPANDISTLEAFFKSAAFAGNLLAGFILEPVQGEGGIHIMTKEYLQAARRLCTEYGTMLIFDEVQSGMGRTGRWWGCDHADVSPDIMALGKSFGGGVMPAGACMANEKVWQSYIEEPFIMTTTFGGNPLAMAAAIATIDVINSEDLITQAKTKGAYFLEKLKAFQTQFPHVIREVRGLGLMIGIDFQTNELGWEFSKGTFKRGVLVSGTLVNAKVVRVEPPLTISMTQIDTVLGVMKETLQQLASAKV